MFQVKGFYLPDGETHLIPLIQKGPEFAGGPTYQLHKLLGCLPYVKNFRTAIDIGAHCGLWSRPLSVIFRRVEAFEPVPAHIACFYKNLTAAGNVTLYEYALGPTTGQVRLHTGLSSSGDTYISPDGEHYATMRALDEFDDIVDVDFIKIDCEGYEYHVLRSGENTIRKYRPTVIVEQKPGKGKQFGLADTAACTLLESWGAKQVYEYAGDYGYRFP